MTSVKLDLTHQELLTQRFQQLDITLSEYTFANLYLFRQNHQYEVVTDGEIFVKGKTYDGFTYLMPTRDVRQIDLDLVKSQLRTVDFLFPIPTEWRSHFPTPEFEFDYNEADTDYLYTVEKMATFKGRKLSKKRNLLKQFLALYQPEPFTLNAGRLDDAVKVLDQWQTDVQQPREATDYYPCREALKLLEPLQLFALIYYVNGEPGGFIISEEINPQTLALHFAKGIKKYKGLYQYMYNTFANVLSNRYQQLNFEQDLGKLELKIAKASYLPDALLKKYRVRLK